jgi:hypothetical protein
MKQIFSYAVISACFLLSIFSASAQLRLPAVDHSISNEVEKVVRDYPNHFENITGELIIQNPQSTDYQSTVKLKDAEECIVTEYPSSKQNHYSWQAKLFTGDDFDAAAKKFKSCYNQLQNMTVKIGLQAYHFSGSYETPSDEKKFTAVLFESAAKDELMGKLKIELLMEYEMLEWKIKIAVYEREREDNERGDVKD